MNLKTNRASSEKREFQLYKHHFKTDEISKAHEPWKPMTEKGAAACLRTYKGTYQPACRFFVAPIASVGF